MTGLSFLRSSAIAIAYYYLLRLDFTNAFINPSALSKASINSSTRNTSVLLSSSTLQESETSATANTNNLTPTGADLKAWAKGYTTCPKELSPTIIDIDDLPDDFPVGTYYRNGHARFEADDGTNVLHPFDGDGMIVAMTFDPTNKRMLFRNSFIETKGYVQDKATGKMSARGIFGTMRSGGMLANAFRTANKNVANTNVVHCGNTLYALWEGGRPYELDPLTLKNKKGPGVSGETSLDGLVDKQFSAHPRYDPKNKVYVNFGVDFDPSSGTTISLYELDEETFRSTKRSSPSILSEGPGLIHDFILTENYCIFNINKCVLNEKNALKALVGLSGFASCIDIDECAIDTSIVVIPRSLFDETNGVTGIDYTQDDRITVVNLPNHFNFHYGNAFEDQNGYLVFDTAQTEEIDLEAMSEMTDTPVWDLADPFGLTSPNTLVRYTLDLRNKCIATDTPPKVLSTRIPEFPSLPRELSTMKHRYLYPVASHIDVSSNSENSGPAGALQKVDTEHPEETESFAFESYEFPGEAVLVAKEGRDISQEEDAMYLLVNIVNGRDQTTDVAIFDVEGNGTFSDGPIVRQRLPTFLPHMLHGNFFEGVTFDFDKAVN